MNDPVAFVVLAVLLLYSVILHEVAHGWVAYQMGDGTVKWQGRLTLNPLKHLDPTGSLMLLIVGFGWAKPVPFTQNDIFCFNANDSGCLF
jgi:Zn-dependent protease